jgi:ribosomal protein S18 acetylase RimI-like enzyme
MTSYGNIEWHKLNDLCHRDKEETLTIVDRHEASLVQLYGMPSVLYRPSIDHTFLVTFYNELYVFYDSYSEIKHKVIGYAVIRKKKIIYFEIIPEYRCKGIARFLLTKCMSDLWKTALSDSSTRAFWNKMKKEK